MNSKRKGKAGELEVAHILTENGFPARRGQQFAGGHDSPDVVCEALDWLHMEVKRDEHLNLDKAMLQAEMDKKSNQVASVVHRKNGTNWKITLDFLWFLNYVSSNNNK